MERILVSCGRLLHRELDPTSRARRRSEGHKRRATVFFTPLDPFGDDTEEEFNDDLSKPRKVHYKSEWKVSQDKVNWINLRKAQEKGLQLVEQGKLSSSGRAIVEGNLFNIDLGIQGIPPNAVFGE